jgi:hypothetical protein
MLPILLSTVQYLAYYLFVSEVEVDSVDMTEVHIINFKFRQLY